jgi:hypothetical protein
VPSILFLPLSLRLPPLSSTTSTVLPIKSPGFPSPSLLISFSLSSYLQLGRVLQSYLILLLRILELPPGELKPKDVCVKMLASPINPSDINRIQGLLFTPPYLLHIIHISCYSLLPLIYFIRFVFTWCSRRISSEASTACRGRLRRSWRGSHHGIFCDWPFCRRLGYSLSPFFWYFHHILTENSLFVRLFWIIRSPLFYRRVNMSQCLSYFSKVPIAPLLVYFG